MKVGNLFTLKLIEYKETTNLSKTKIQVTNLLCPEEEPLIVRHFHEKNWEDDQAMDQYTDIDEMIALTKKYREQAPDAPVVVHCSAGLGRTGTLICIYAILEALECLKAEHEAQKQLPEDQRLSFPAIEQDYDSMNLFVPRISVFGAARKMREQRWSLVKKPKQYHFIYQYLHNFVNKKYFDEVISIHSEDQDIKDDELKQLQNDIRKAQEEDQKKMQELHKEEHKQEELEEDDDDSSVEGHDEEQKIDSNSVSDN